MNFAEGTVANGAQGPVLELADGVRVPLTQAAVQPGAKLTLGVRPEHIETVAAPDGIAMEVEVIEPTGAETHLYGKVGGATWCVTSRERAALEPGQRVALRLPAQHMHLFDTQSGAGSRDTLSR